jgi:hypothetical protein
MQFFVVLDIIDIDKIVVKLSFKTNCSNRSSEQHYALSDLGL